MDNPMSDRELNRNNFTSALAGMKRRGERIVMLTAYDATFASLLEQSEAIDLILVGDSLGMVVQGKHTTREVTLAQMVYHVRMVADAVSSTPIIGDLPYHTFETADEALENAHVLMQAGAWAVKFEGNHYEAARAIVEAGIPLMGHLGLLPQTAEKFSVHGKSEEEARAIEEDALQLEEAGVFSLVLESIPRGLAERVTRALSIPSIGIGAGPDCNGQVLVTHDMLGLTIGRVPKFVKKYADIGGSIREAVKSYAKEVREGSFPSDSHTYH